ncbi:hypothetical protein ABEB36_010047 [Hypothenemus hampei]|uniref:Uncharacterized protein n=1 Tax=Hypothenemus hampei TaxID=57062 RepID=A0ABD1EIS0_HYPHA
MNKDKYFERRMIVSKYSNRPPFELKKSKQDSQDILEKIKMYPEEICKNCCSNQSSVKPLSSKPQSYPSQELKTSDSIIPKVLEHFQKATPSSIMNHNTYSIHILYRNDKLGKNIPKHKLMKSLLENLDKNPKKDVFRDRKPRKQTFFDRDETIKPDFNVYGKGRKIDKKTSTTGLSWSSNYACFREIKPRCCLKRLIKEDVPTKDVPQLSSNGKSFVQNQVEKLNKVFKKDVKDKRNFLSETTKDYLGLMDKVRRNCPHYLSKKSLTNSDGDWSEPEECPTINPATVKFPRETRTAIDQRMSDHKQRIPLSKYTILNERSYRPKILQYNKDSQRSILN